ncbi:hypothetical protein P5G51_014180 [Virgibacillus sp. 179-BFC.A HS]|uniref:DUF3139 domain-containing protein n=1 Tax=Tigheibacillus jepli TaxID=3035914 RepID=A0ABU5CJH5_9BACI|nr:hypothetical protein [Virgibacillus sp. 179-BFC.A HS]MDY0406385.1 hypothetical protein [Virgibacillus sp. 179-BFC.A HS]
MLVIVILFAVAISLFMFRCDKKYETVYSGSESNVGEANEYYWLLKSHKIPFKYQIPYSWENFYQFGYKESPIYIKVHEKDMDRARKAMMHYRIEKMKIERNIQASRNNR